VAEGGGLLNRYTVNSRIVGSNPIPSANSRQNRQLYQQKSGLIFNPTYPVAYPALWDRHANSS
jgi:hypothetical protein